MAEDRDRWQYRVVGLGMIAEQLFGTCLSPQCGFASNSAGNHLTTDEQWAKLARVVEIAREVWP
jgi:5-methyltetrahydropteroyltriglutamate--homocysteine methyltransferase